MSDYWDATRIRALKECPQKLQYMYEQNWRKKGDQNVHLLFGQAFATGLERFYLGASIEDVVLEALTLEGLPEQGAKTNKTLARSLVWYTDHYKKEKTLTLPNGKKAVEVHFTWIAAPGIVFTGHLDRIAEIDGHPYILDQKTTMKKPNDFYFRQFRQSDQVFMYSLVAKEILGSPIAGIIIDAVSVTEDRTELSRDLVQFSAPQIDEWYADTLDWILLMGKKEIKNMNACPRCDFFPVCKNSPHIRENLLKTGYYKGEPWTPEVSRT